MSAQDLSDVVRVTSYESTREVNELLEVGWRLLDIYNQTVGSGEGQQAVYVLGWPRSAGDPIDPIVDRRKREEGRHRREMEEWEHDQLPRATPAMMARAMKPARKNQDKTK